jgi:hypothetical protein
MFLISALAVLSVLRRRILSWVPSAIISVMVVLLVCRL